MSRVFITGIEGFVGSHLARYLADQGFETSGFFFVAPQVDLSFARVRYCDIRNPAQLQTLLDEDRPDYVIHLAAVSSVAIAEQGFSDTIDVNVRGTLHLLDHVRRLNPRPRVLLISSSEVYDRSVGVRLNEEAPVRPLNNYAFTKLASEQVGRYYADRHGLDVVILRPFSHTGPGQSANFVFPSVARQIAEAELGRRKPEIQVGNLDVSRDYTDVRDICRAYELALLKAARGEVYNITSEQTLRIGDGIQHLVSLARTPIVVKVASDRVRQEGVVLAGSAGKFRSATGWQPQFDVKTTLRDVLDYERRLAQAQTQT